jgi:hypothetical protein
MAVDVDHPLPTTRKVLRKTLASCTKAHTPEDDDTRSDPSGSLPSMMQ